MVTLSIRRFAMVSLFLSRVRQDPLGNEVQVIRIMNNLAWPCKFYYNHCQMAFNRLLP